MSGKLDCVSELRADIRVLITKLEFIEKESAETKRKIDKVHNWVIGASAVVALLVFVGPTIAQKLWPSEHQNIIVQAAPMGDQTGGNSHGAGSVNQTKSRP